MMIHGSKLKEYCGKPNCHDGGVATAERVLIGSNFSLTHYHPAMPFGNRKKIFSRIFPFSIARV